MKVNLILLCFITMTLNLSIWEDNCTATDPEFLTTFHPHLDAFWLNTDDQLKDINFKPAPFLYDMNQRNSKTILNSMLEALMLNNTRKYFVTEVVFFKDWYDYLDQEAKEKVKVLLKSKQLQIPNAGWVENDEAVCYYDDILDQYTLGMNFMYEEFQKTTKIGWATDSFGHSHSQVALQHLLGIEFQGIQRVDDRYIHQRTNGSLLEFYWSPVSDSNQRKYGGVLTQVRHFLHELNDLRNESPRSIAEDYDRLEQYMITLYGKNKLFRFLGNDFEEFITAQFLKLEEAMVILNKGKSSCKEYKYGNPEDYLKIIKIYWKNHAVPIREFDFMPNYDQDHYWAGYYTTDPALKKICKDYSRLVNLYKKIITKTILLDNSSYKTYQSELQTTMQLLAVVQHHDGITATSKHAIESLFKERMANSSKNIIKSISDIKGVSGQVICQLFVNGDACEINSTANQILLVILHEGVPKTQSIELHLVQGTYYDAGMDEELFCTIDEKCIIIIDPVLTPGRNQLKLKKVSKDTLTVFPITAIPNTRAPLNYNNTVNNFLITLTSNSITYNFSNSSYFKFTFTTSKDDLGATNTTSWTKYGMELNGTQQRRAGIYIMANDGVLDVLDAGFNSLEVGSGNRYTKIYIRSNMSNITVTLTINHQAPNILNFETTFSPATSQLLDYFLKVESNVKNENEFYHDMNGYLVSKRTIGQRPDYDWIYKPEDKINANTYPACTFAYLLQNHQKVPISIYSKFIAFFDRAHGFTTYDGAFLINIDRLAGDDFKGVGEGYSFIVQNTFRFKFALEDAAYDLERQWQRSFDDAVLAFLSETSSNQSDIKSMQNNSSGTTKYGSSTKSTDGINTTNSTNRTNSTEDLQILELVPVFEPDALLCLKYSIWPLNEERILIRLHNLAELRNISIPIYSNNSWLIAELSLNLSYVDITESFANGIPLHKRHNWINITGQHNVQNAAQFDTPTQIVLSPLQIRSFIIHLKNPISAQVNTSNHHNITIVSSNAGDFVKSRIFLEDK